MCGTMFYSSLLSSIFVLGPETKAAKADEPAQAEKLPAPRQNTAPAVETIVPVPFPMYHRVSRYEVWQLVAVDHRGQFLPRVAYTPYGAYYLYNGAPYYYLPTRPTEFSPILFGTPYRSLPEVVPYPVPVEN